MRRPLYAILLFFVCRALHAQQSIEAITNAEPSLPVTETTIFYQLGNTIIPIKIQQYGERKDIVFINLHDDELTSVEATKRILPECGGVLIEIENNAARNIRFQLNGRTYKIDPNQIFSKQGIQRSLAQFGSSSERAIAEVERFGQRILQLFPEQTECIIALHNNTEGLFSVVDYARSDKRAAESKKVYIDHTQDMDDFFLTTDNLLFEKLADKGFNTILQNNKSCTEDGSLSVYCGRKNIRYVNCETEHGKTAQYFEMINSLMTIVLLKQ